MTVSCDVRNTGAVAGDEVVIAGLRSGRGVLSIDGVNLVIQPQTPQYRQASDVMRLLEARQRLVADNLRAVALAEHLAAPNLEHPLSLEQMRPILANREATSGAAEIERDALASYEQLKARETVDTVTALYRSLE